MGQSDKKNQKKQRKSNRIGGDLTIFSRILQESPATAIPTIGPQHQLQKQELQSSCLSSEAVTEVAEGTAEISTTTAAALALAPASTFSIIVLTGVDSNDDPKNEKKQNKMDDGTRNSSKNQEYASVAAVSSSSSFSSSMSSSSLSMHLLSEQRRQQIHRNVPIQVLTLNYENKNNRKSCNVKDDSVGDGGDNDIVTEFCSLDAGKDSRNELLMEQLRFLSNSTFQSISRYWELDGSTPDIATDYFNDHFDAQHHHKQPQNKQPNEEDRNEEQIQPPRHQQRQQRQQRRSTDCSVVPLAATEVEMSDDEFESFHLKNKKTMKNYKDITETRSSRKVTSTDQCTTVLAKSNCNTLRSRVTGSYNKKSDDPILLQSYYITKLASSVTKQAIRKSMTTAKNNNIMNSILQLQTYPTSSSSFKNNMGTKIISSNDDQLVVKDQYVDATNIDDTIHSYQDHVDNNVPITRELVYGFPIPSNSFSYSSTTLSNSSGASYCCACYPRLIPQSQQQRHHDDELHEDDENSNSNDIKQKSATSAASVVGATITKKPRISDQDSSLKPSIQHNNPNNTMIMTEQQYSEIVSSSSVNAASGDNSNYDDSSTGNHYGDYIDDTIIVCSNPNCKREYHIRCTSCPPLSESSLAHPTVFQRDQRTSASSSFFTLPATLASTTNSSAVQNSNYSTQYLGSNISITTATHSNWCWLCEDCSPHGTTNELVFYLEASDDAKTEFLHTSELHERKRQQENKLHHHSRSIKKQKQKKQQQEPRRKRPFVPVNDIPESRIGNNVAVGEKSTSTDRNSNCKITNSEDERMQKGSKRQRLNVTKTTSPFSASNPIASTTSSTLQMDVDITFSKPNQKRETLSSSPSSQLLYSLQTPSPYVLHLLRKDLANTDLPNTFDLPISELERSARTDQLARMDPKLFVMSAPKLHDDEDDTTLTAIKQMQKEQSHLVGPTILPPPSSARTINDTFVATNTNITSSSKNEKPFVDVPFEPLRVDEFLGKPIRMYIPISNQYHTGRIVDYRTHPSLSSEDRTQHQIQRQPSSHNTNMRLSSSDSVTASINSRADANTHNALHYSETEFLIRFASGVDGRKATHYHWIYLEEHALAVGTTIVMAQVNNHIDLTWKPTLLWSRTARELVPVMHRLDAKQGQIFFIPSDSSSSSTTTTTRKNYHNHVPRSAGIHNIASTVTKVDKSRYLKYKRRARKKAWALVRTFGHVEYDLIDTKQHAYDILDSRLQKKAIETDNQNSSSKICSVSPATTHEATVPISSTSSAMALALALALELARTELFEQERVRRWRKMEQINLFDSHVFRSRDYYSLPSTNVMTNHVSEQHIQQIKRKIDLGTSTGEAHCVIQNERQHPTCFMNDNENNETSSRLLCPNIIVDIDRSIIARLVLCQQQERNDDENNSDPYSLKQPTKDLASSLACTLIQHNSYMNSQAIVKRRIGTIVNLQRRPP